MKEFDTFFAEMETANQDKLRSGLQVRFEIMNKDKQAAPEILKEMQEKKESFQKIWDTHGKLINEELAKTFSREMPNKECIGRISTDPGSPRFLSDSSFNLPYTKTPDEALATSIHEIIHFLWFEKWKDVYPNCEPEKDFEHPSFSWLLSEISVDPIIKSSESLAKLAKDKPAYPHFYTSEFCGATPIESFTELYSANSLNDYMTKGLEHLKNNQEQAEALVPVFNSQHAIIDRKAIQQKQGGGKDGTE